MKLRILTAAIIFVGSYLPLSVILLAQNFDYQYIGKPVCWKFWAEDAACIVPLKNPGFAIGIFVVCLICFILTLAALAIVRPKHEIIVIETEYMPAELMNYVLPYIVSFMSLDYPGNWKICWFYNFFGLDVLDHLQIWPDNSSIRC